MDVRIAAAGKYLPLRRVSNEEIGKIFSLDAETIHKKTGIRNRCFAGPSEHTSDLALEACADLFGHFTEIKKEDVEAIVLCTGTPDHSLPGSVHALQNKLGLNGIPVYELRGASGDFLKALHLGSLLIRQGTHRNALIIGADLNSRRLDFSENGRDASILFGDGAGAFLLTSSEEEAGIRDFIFGADASYLESLYLPDKGYLQMDGKTVMLEAIKRVGNTVSDLLNKNGLNKEQIRYFIFHQANARLLEFIAKTLELKPEQVFNNIETTGNTSSASIPICYADLIRSKEIRPGDRIVLAGFSSGFSYGACLIYA